MYAVLLPYLREFREEGNRCLPVRRGECAVVDVVLEFPEVQRTEIDVGKRHIGWSLADGSNRHTVPGASHHRQYLSICVRYKLYTRQGVDVRHMR
jgi:hypothetical protein